MSQLESSYIKNFKLYCCSRSASHFQKFVLCNLVKIVRKISRLKYVKLFNMQNIRIRKEEKGRKYFMKKLEYKRTINIILKVKDKRISSKKC